MEEGIEDWEWGVGEGREKILEESAGKGGLSIVLVFGLGVRRGGS